MISKTLINIIVAYKKHISVYMPFKCIYNPTCSEYALIALQKYSLMDALRMIIIRIVRCNPFCKGGYDPVP